MSDFGRALFSGSKFLFWAIVPLISLIGLLLLNALFTFSVAGEWRVVFLIVLLELSFVLLGVSLWNPKKFWIASRALTAVVFLVILALLLHQIMFGERSLLSLTTLEMINGDPPANIFKAFLFVGIPCFLYTCFGLWKLREVKTSLQGSK